MKIIALLLAVFALVSSAVALKDDRCLEQHSMGGQCLGYFPMYSYNADTNECVEFIYGGCGGNSNRFPVEEDCEDLCKE